MKYLAQLTKEQIARRLVNALMFEGFLPSSMPVEDYEERVESWCKRRTKEQLIKALESHWNN